MILSSESLEMRAILRTSQRFAGALIGILMLGAFSAHPARAVSRHLFYEEAKPGLSSGLVSVHISDCTDAVRRRLLKQETKLSNWAFGFNIEPELYAAWY